MSKTDHEREFDVRLIERNLHLGRANSKAYQEHLKSLPDSSNNAQYVEVYNDNDTTIVENFDAGDDLAFNLEP